MGARYVWDERCESCGTMNAVAYAESCGITSWKCEKCGRKYNIIQNFTSVVVPTQGESMKAAIDVLRFALQDNIDLVKYIKRLNQYPEKEKRESCRQVIAVLEAAGRVDKEAALRELAVVPSSWRSPSPAGFLGMSHEIHSQIRALLESLPDKEKP